MLSLGLADSRAISKTNSGSERHLREVIKRLSLGYKLYYLPTTHTFLDAISEDQLKEIKEIRQSSLIFEYLLDKKLGKASLLRELLTFSHLAKELVREYEREIGILDFVYGPPSCRIQLMPAILFSKLSRGKYGMLLMTDPHNSLLEKESFLNA